MISNEQQGMLMKEALIEAGGTRIRPILMTAVATIGALLPLLFGQNSSILISKGMAATVIGGLVSSTLLTLIVVPVIYEILFTLKTNLHVNKDKFRISQKAIETYAHTFNCFYNIVKVKIIYITKIIIDIIFKIETPL